MSVIARLLWPADESRSSFAFAGSNYWLPPFTFGGGAPLERPDTSTSAWAAQMVRGTGPVFAVERVRLEIVSQIRFQWQEMRGGRPGDLFGDNSLAILERPWPNATTSDLVARMLLAADISGNAYVVVGDSGYLSLLDPNKVTIVVAEPDSPTPTLLGYLYNIPGGENVVYTPSEVAHFAPYPDPAARFRGMPWMMSVTDQALGHAEATIHKRKFYVNGANAGLVITYDASVPMKFVEEFKALFDAEHAGAANAYRTLHLGGGADVRSVGQTFEQMAWKATQGSDETMIAAASGVPAVLAQFSEGLAGSSLNAGNYTAAKHQFADGAAWYLAEQLAGALETLLPRPPAARLWPDVRDVPFWRQDAKDAAAVRQENALTIEALVRAGFTPGSVVPAVVSGDFSLLVHTGLYSVQLQPPLIGGEQ